MRTKIEARQFSEEADARSCKSGQRYEIAAKAVFAELGRCGENEKTNQFDSDLTTTEPFDESNCNGEDRGGSRDTSEKRRGRDQWWPGQLWPPKTMGRLLRPPQW